MRLYHLPLEAVFHPRSFGFRPGRGCKDALREVDRLVKEGYGYVVDADLKSDYDTIPHDRLMTRLAGLVSDGRLLDLVRSWLEQDIMAECESWKPTSGTPQGGVISPLLANLYLHRLDVLMAERGLEMVRYADDFVILCRSMAEAQAALETVRGFADENGLTLHPDKTHIGDCRIKGQGFEFLGYRFGAGRRLVRKKSLLSLRERIRERTRRTSAASLERVIASLNPMLKGWFEYFKHATHGLQDVDAFIRRRLRAMLRKQDKRPRPRTVANGRTLSSQKPGCSPWKPPGELRDAPDEETLDRRAVCGKTARTVRREGRRKRLPYLYQRWHHTPPHQAKQRRLRRNVVTTRPSIAARLDCFA